MTDLKLWVNGEPADMESLECVIGSEETGKIKELTVGSDAICAVFSNKEGEKGTLTLKLNEYDTSFFSLRVGNIFYFGDDISGKEYAGLFKCVMSQALKEGYNYVFFNVPQKLSFLEQPVSDAGFEKCTSSVDLFMDLKNRMPDKICGAIRMASSGDEKHLSDIASRAFRRSRLYNTGVLSPEKVDEYHAKWITNLMNSDSDTVFVVDKNDKPAGFLTVKTYPGQRNGRIILLATDENYRRQGLGRTLLDGVLGWALGRLDGLYVKTQESNTPAITLYEKIGFRIVDRENGYHFILKA
jgi:ribosomal protein S18 acetylase RimI-like enzyme